MKIEDWKNLSLAQKFAKVFATVTVEGTILFVKVCFAYAVVRWLAVTFSR